MSTCVTILHFFEAFRKPNNDFVAILFFSVMLSTLHKRGAAALFLPGTAQESAGQRTRDRKACDAQHRRGVQRVSLDQNPQREQKNAEREAADEAGKKA